MTQPLPLDHIVVLLSDLESGIGFYDQLLPLIGLTKTRNHVFAGANGIHFDFRQAGEPQWGYHRHAPGLNHLGFAAADRDEIVAIGEAMQAAGFEVPDIQEFDDGSALFLRDADGMRVEIGCYRA